MGPGFEADQQRGKYQYQPKRQLAAVAQKSFLDPDDQRRHQQLGRGIQVDAGGKQVLEKSQDNYKEQGKKAAGYDRCANRANQHQVRKGAEDRQTREQDGLEQQDGYDK